jgi:hypothetical protein
VSGERRKIRGQGGAVVYMDIGRDCDQRTFDAMVERGEWVIVEDEPTKPATRVKK